MAKKLKASKATRKAAGSRPTKRAVKKTSRKSAARTTEHAAEVKPAPAETDTATARYLRDLLVRGEAAPLDEKGKLTADATHVVTGQSADGTLKVKRVRFKAF